MTLEKLLIFGFGLAVVSAIVFTATNMSNDRAPDFSGYKTKTQTMLEKMR